MMRKATFKESDNLQKHILRKKFFCFSLTNFISKIQKVYLAEIYSIFLHLKKKFVIEILIKYFILDFLNPLKLIFFSPR